MPYNPSTGVYSLPAIYLAIPGTVIIAAQHNDPLVDLQTANNYPRPIIAGGTEADNPTLAANNLEVVSYNVQSFGDPEQLIARQNIEAEKQIVYAAKSGNDTAGVGENNTFFRFTASATLSLASAATLGANWCCTVKADGANVTIDPSSSQLIDGATTALVPNGTTVFVICDGTAFWTSKPGYYSLLRVPRFITASATYTPPNEVKALLVKCVGAGGGGGGCASGASGTSAAGGGGGGAMAMSFITSIASSYAMTVGQGGAGGAVGGNAGLTGGTTQFGTACIAVGGSGGAASNATTSTLFGGNGGNGGLAASCTGNVMTVGGGAGTAGVRYSTLGAQGGMGGGSGNGDMPSQQALLFTSGGSSGGTSPDRGTGGLGSVAVSNTDRAGGTGGNGYILIYEYI